MRFTLAALAAGFAGVAIAQNATASDVYVTEVVTAFTTYCPEATQLTHGGQTYTVSEATTLTVTNCPGGCTIVKPASSYVPSFRLWARTDNPQYPSSTYCTRSLHQCLQRFPSRTGAIL